MTSLNSFTETSPLLLIGGGKMGGALLSGWLSQGLSPKAVLVADPSEVIRAHYNSVGVTAIAGPSDLNRSPHAALFATKPQVMAGVLAAYRAVLPSSCLALSIAAGLSLAFFRDGLAPNTPIVRAMPNTPAAVGAGISALFAADDVSAEHRQLCEQLLSSVGEVVWLNRESQMDAVTGVSGSGPAYVFHMIECLAAAGVAEGLPEAMAIKLAQQTVFGAGKLAVESTDSAEQLRINVTSPNGTTAAGLAELMPVLPELVSKTVAAAAARSRELSTT